MTDCIPRHIERIVILRALKLGDFLLAIPAFRALRAAYPDAHIDYIGLEWNRVLVNQYRAYFDGFTRFPGYPGLPEQSFEPSAVVEFLQQVQANHYDLALQMQGNGTIVNPLVELFGAKVTAGFASARSYWPNTQHFMEYPEGRHEVLRNLDLLQFLGIEDRGRELEFPVTSTDKENLAKVVEFQHIQNKDYVCLHPGAITARPWSPVNFARLADWCITQGLTVVLTGTVQEAPLAKQVMSHMKHRGAADWTGKTDLLTLAALLQGSRLTVSNDTGVGHLAVAVDVPTITIYTSTEPGVWGPLERQHHKVIAGKQSDTADEALRQATELLTCERSMA